MDVMSPSIAEAARRLLRTEDTTLFVPHALLAAANELSLEISDGIPKLIREPNVTVGPEHQITLPIYVRLVAMSPDWKFVGFRHHQNHSRKCG